MNFLLIFFSLLLIYHQPAICHSPGKYHAPMHFKSIVSSTSKIDLTPFSGAFNPSICACKEGFILTFRYLPDTVEKLWISHIGVVLLDHSFQQISAPQLLNLRQSDSPIPSQTEDARIFSWNDKFYIVYNDNVDVTNGSALDRRDIYIAELQYASGQFTASAPLKLSHSQQYSVRLWEKNWTPFVKGDSLFFSYSLDPHEVLCPDFETGICSPCFFTANPTFWKWGALRGGSPALLVEDEYLAFFHSSAEITSGASNGEQMYHYFMGAYTFSSTPPFELTKISPLPIMDTSFYLKSSHEKRVIYPGGYVVSGDKIYVAYGKNDDEVWIAEIYKEKLLKSLKSIRK